jgi:hypothetical protein
LGARARRGEGQDEERDAGQETHANGAVRR